MANIGNKEVMSKSSQNSVLIPPVGGWVMADFLKYFEKLSKKVLTKRHF